MTKFKIMPKTLGWIMALSFLITGCSENDSILGGGGVAAPDTTAPTVISTAPADSAIDVAFNAKISANFSEALDPTTVNSSSFTLTNGGTPVAGVVSYTGTTATFNPTDDLIPDTLYTATLSTTITDLAAPSNALAADHIWTFTTGATPDTTAPTVNSTTPVDAAIDVAINANISANFSEALDPTTVNAESFFVTIGGNPVAGVVSYSGTAVTFNPTANLASDTLYTATLTTAITDLVDPANPLASDYVWSFTTTSAPDITAPTVISTTPVDAAINVAINANIGANFSEALDPTTVNTSSFVVTDGSTAVTGVVSYAGTAVTFNPTGDLASNTVYTATLTTAITDLSDPANPLASDYVWSFTTAAAADTTAPTVNSTTPADSAINVAINANISANFSEALDPATVNTSSFLVTNGGTPVTGVVSYAGTAVTFNPTGNLAADTLYTATLTTAITDLADPANPLASDYVWSFTTAAAADTTAPTVISTTPVNAAIDVAINANISANFSEALDPATVNSSSFTLSNGGTPVTGVVSYAGTAVTFNPTGNLTADTLYTATLTTAITDLADPANPLASNYVWSFTTAAAADTTAPTVNSTTPVDAAVNVAINANISANFSEALDPTTVTSSSFTVTNGGTLVTGVVSYAGLTATFNPTGDLVSNTLYTATLTTTITDLADPANPLASNYVWTFTTAVAADTTAPTVNSTSPVDAAIDVAINANISANFSEALDPATVNSSSFTLTNGGTPVAGVVSYVGTTATFNPSSNLAANTLFTATLTTEITDLAVSPNSLVSNYVWTFTSGAIPDTTAPTVISTTPVDAATAVALSANISASFSEALDPTTVNSNSFLVTNGGTPVGGIVSYAGTTATFNPTSDFAADTLYTVTLTTEMTDLADSPNSLASNYVWTFTSDLSTPTVTVIHPLDDEIDVATNKNVVATFSEPMDATTIDTVSFTLTAPGPFAVSGTVSFDVASNSAKFSPDSDLIGNTVYTATLTSAIMSSAGKALAADYIWSFTTGTAPDVTAPTVISTDPLDGAIDVPVNRDVVAEFSEALESTSITTSSFIVTDGVTPVAGTVVYAGTTATFNPNADLAGDTLYTATLTTDITDLATPANSLASDYVWSFTTNAAPAQGPEPVNLRTAGNFVILTKAGITNVHTSAITGNIGASPITSAAMDNVFCTEITGTIYGADAAYTGSGDIPCFAGVPADNTLVANAVLDMGTAYNDAAGRTTPDFTELYAGDISGQNLIPGLYKWSTDVLISTDVTLTGGANDVWIFQVSGDVTQASASSIILAGGALAKNVFWQVEGGSGVIIGTSAHFEGVVIAQKAIVVNTGASVTGRLFAHTAVTLDQNAVTEPAE
jgi:methionine-rich copper-binding protein CopC